jgi:C1A family cysteine protease
MKFAATFAAASAMQLDLAIVDLDSNTMSIDQKFELYKEKYGKTYTNEAAALAAFTENDKIIQEHNAGDFSWTLGHNEFSDLTWEEFSSKYVGGYDSNPHLNRTKDYDYSLLEKTDLADSVDWVTKGAVSPVKNQAQCGSCWAFSTVGSLEGAYQIAGNPLTQFSEQDLVSCDNAAHGGTDQGCNGGLMDNAFKWIEKNGICTETDYPYTSGTGSSGTCKTTCQKAATLTGYKDVPGEAALKAAIAIGPVSVAIEADKSAFQLYKGGVLDNTACGKRLDHGVLVVGYGTDSTSGKDYYKVKNSWGANWGEKGYIRMVQGKDQCGIADQPSYPTGVKPMGPGPAPGPSPPGPSPGPGPAPGGTHYGDPSAGCMSDEESVQITGITGDFCSPECTGLLKNKCPTDLPAGVTAQPECALKDSSGGKRCALICNPAQYAGECGTATCKPIQGTGLCTYDD